MLVDVAVVGGGPAGLAVAIGAARRGLSVAVLEARSGATDKACGEGILPAGVAALDELGISGALADAARLDSVRWIDRDGATAEALLPHRGGLGVRRTTLIEALRARASSEGAALHDGVRVRSHLRTRRSVALLTDLPEMPRIDASVLVAADGLSSPLRRAEGLDVPMRASRRFGMRRHFAVRPWSSSVEVHLGDGMEAYVTPVGPERVGVALLFEHETRGRASFDALLLRFPALAERLHGAPAASKTLGAGPFERAAHSRTHDRFALVGDAAGYLDAVTGEGLSLSFRAARVLAESLPDAVLRGGEASCLRRYERFAASDFRKYAWIARTVLALTRAGGIRGSVLRALARSPRVLDAAVRWSTT